MKYFIFIFFVLLTTGCNKINNQLNTAQEFYNLYSENIDNGGSLETFIKTTHEKNFFSDELKQMLLDDINCSNSGEICALDADPFFDAQDKIDIENFTVINSDIVEVEFKNNNKLKLNIVCNKTNKCLIYNIIYSDKQTLLKKLQDI